MALQLGALRDALVEAGASNEAASHEDRINHLRLDLPDVKSDVKLLKWMVGGIDAGIMSPMVGVLVLILRARGFGG